MRQRVKLLEESIRNLQEELEPLQTMLSDGERVLGLEFLSQDLEVYLGWKKDKADYAKKQQEQKNLRERLEQLKSQNVAAWEEERASLVELCRRREKVLDQLKLNVDRAKRDGEKEKQELLQLEGFLADKERNYQARPEFDGEFQKLLEQKQESGAAIRYDLLRGEYLRGQAKAQEKQDAEMQKLSWEVRNGYLRTYPHRNFLPNPRTTKSIRNYWMIFPVTASRNTGNVPRNRRRQRWSILRTTSCTRSAVPSKEALQRKGRAEPHHQPPGFR